MRDRFARWLLDLLGLVPASELARHAQLETHMKALGVTEATLAEYGQAMIYLAQAGAYSADEIADAYMKGMAQAYTRVRDLQWAKHATPAQIDRRSAAIMNGDPT